VDELQRLPSIFAPKSELFSQLLGGAMQRTTHFSLGLASQKACFEIHHRKQSVAIDGAGVYRGIPAPQTKRRATLVAMSIENKKIFSTHRVFQKAR
jgi:hypothetical protein